MVPGTGVEPVRPCGPQDFKSGVSTSSTTRVGLCWKANVRQKKIQTLGLEIFKRAEDRARTGYPDLGKVVLYQMSYFRIYTP